MQNRKCWAFLVGINQYTDYRKLDYCVDDVRALETLLDRVGYIPVCLHDRLNPRDRRFPSRVNILAELKSLLDRVSDGDLLLVYFACHGDRSSSGKKPMLIAADTRKRELARSAISFLDDLEPLIRQSKAQQKVLMLDACFMGQGRGQKNPAEFLRKVNQLARGFEIISASSETQEALESAGLKHSIFCHFVLKGLAGEAALGEQGQQIVMLSDLKRYVMAEMSEYTVRQGLDQTPQGRGEGNLGDFMLVDYTNQPLPNLEEIQGSELSQTGGPQAQGRGKSRTAEVIESLWSLNYTQQLQIFETRIPKMRSGAIIAIQAENYLLQFWLAKRLFRKLPIPITNAYNECIFISASKALDSFDFFWEELGKGLKVEALELQLTCQQRSQMIIEKLIEQYSTKNVVIVIQNWPQRSSNRLNAKALRTRIIDEFWQPLRKEMIQQSVAPLRHRLILCLLDNKGRTSNLRDLKTEISDSVDLINLDPLSITSDELERWILAHELLPQLRDDSDVEQFLADFSNPENLENAEMVIGEICTFCGLDNGIADIEAEWRLAG